MTDWPRLFFFATRNPGEAFGLATLVARTGSSYRPLGARMLITAHGRYEGSISGGCLEDEIARAAVGVLATGLPVLHTIDTRPHYGCPGRLRIFIERLHSGWMSQLDVALRQRVTFYVRTRFSADAEEPGSELWTAPTPPPETEGVFCETVEPTPRLLVISGTDDAEPVGQIAKLLGWQVHRILPLGTVSYVNDRGGGRVCPAEELTNRYAPDARTFVVIMTHHLTRDLHYLRAALPAAYPYIGLLGSRQRRETLLAALGEDGLLEDEAITDKLHAPVGLDLGAGDPASIALAIVAEIQAVLQGRSGGSLHARSGPININEKSRLVGS